MTVQWLTGDVLDNVRALPDNSVDLVACSPPFLALRNYADLDGQWGSEPTPAAFLDNLLLLTAELRRVLTPHGSVAIELGDTYSGSGGAGGDYSGGGMRDDQPRFNGSAKLARTHDPAKGAPIPNMHSRRQGGGIGWPLPKSLTGTPTMFAWSLAYGRNLLNPAHEVEPWRVRNVIVWARNNPPVSALADKVRPCTSYITIACLSERRWFDLDAVRGPASPNSHPRTPKGVRRAPKDGKAIADGRGGNWSTLDEIHEIDGAPPLDHWTDEYDGDLTWLINTQGSSIKHFAMWPARLAERLVLSMCPAQVCRECGEPRTRIIESEPSDCGHDNYRPGRVLDPFCGTGTTVAVADIHGRDATGIDLDPDAQSFYERRYAECWRALKPGPSPVTPHGTQLDLLTEATA